MAQTTIINNFGTVTGWNQHQAVVFGRTLEGIQKITMKDNSEVENVMGGGKYPIGTGEGNYSAEFGWTLLMEEVHAIMKSLPRGMRIQDIPAFDVPVLVIRGGVVVKDVARNVKFKGLGKEVSQGDKAVWMEMPMHCSHIDWYVE